MHIHYIEFKNCMSYGNQLQRIDFKEDGLLYQIAGQNGGGKCLSPDTKLNIEIDDPVIKLKFLDFLEKRNNTKIKVIIKETIISKIKDLKENYGETIIENIIQKVKFSFKDHSNHSIIREINKSDSKLLNVFKYGESNINYWLLRGWTEEESKLRLKKFNRGKEHSPMCEEYWLKRGYSAEEAKIKPKTMRSINTEYWTNKGYSIDEAKEKVSEVQRDNSIKFQNKRKIDPEKYYKSNLNRVEYWIEKGHTKEEAKNIISKRQARGLEFLQNKYGEIDGYDRWLNRNILWSNKMYKNDSVLTHGYSISANVFLENIIKYFENDIIDINSRFLYGKTEKFLSSKKRIYRYDFTDIISKKIIEYNGDYWHCNPINWKDTDFHPVIKKYAKQIWEEYSLKINLAKENGYKVLVVWENEVNTNSEEVIEKCIKFLKYD